MIFVAVVKEQEMEIGGPTDVKHVAHIGMDGSSGSAPSWVVFLELIRIIVSRIKITKMSSN